MATINILGDIGVSAQAEDIITQIQAAKGDKLKVIIASPGGSAFQGLMIHDALKASGKEVTTIALGLGASAAFIIFLAGDKREMGDATLLMGHNSRTELAGTAAQIREDLEAMDAIDDRMKAAVMAASGMSDEDATKLLSKDTFMNSETAMSLGLATDSIQDDIAASLNMNKQEEPVKMATKEEDKQAGFLAHMAKWFKSEVKAEADDEEPKEDEDAKAEGDEEKPEEDAKAEGDDPKKEDEDAKAEHDDEDEEKKEMKSKIESLESELAEAKAKAEGDDEEKKEDEEAKISSILAGITDKKITMHTAIGLSKKSPTDVSAFLGDLQSNATGRGKTEEPKDEAGGSKHDQWKAMKSENNHGLAQKFYNKHSTEIRSEMSKDK